MYLISYDISNDRKRAKVAKVMEDYGRRVQYSVFECILDRVKYEELYGKLLELLKEEELASVRIYNLCEKCRQRTMVIGIEDTKPEPEEVYVI